MKPVRKNYDIKNNSVIIDEDFNQLITEYINTLKHYRKEKVFITLLDFYYHLTKDNYLISRSNCSIILKNLNIKHILSYQEKIENLVYKNKITKVQGNYILNNINQFLIFLSNKKIVSVFYKPFSFNKRSRKPIKIPTYPILNDFAEYLMNNKYSCIKDHVKRVKMFFKSMKFNNQEKLEDNTWLFHIKKFEEHLRIKISKESITTPTAYQYLRSIRLFFTFLFFEKKIGFRYQIPNNLKSNAKRNNEYVNVNDVLTVIETILEKSSDILRDILILLIIFETGCRPIEVCNLTISDINLYEGLIIIHSKKSNQRTLKLSKTIMDLIKVYLKIRRNYLPQEDNQSLFLNSFGKPITYASIYWKIRIYNLDAFNEIRFTPKTLRHTFITNALNNKHNIESVADVIGHKHLVSTLYYFYRDINSIKEIIIGKEIDFKGGNK